MSADATKPPADRPKPIDPQLVKELADMVSARLGLPDWDATGYADAADIISKIRQNGFTIYKSGQSSGNDAAEIAADATHGLDPNLAGQVTTRIEQAYAKFLERHANGPNLGRKP